MLTVCCVQCTIDAAKPLAENMKTTTRSQVCTLVHDALAMPSVTPSILGSKGYNRIHEGCGSASRQYILILAKASTTSSHVFSKVLNCCFAVSIYCFRCS